MRCLFALAPVAAALVAFSAAALLTTDLAGVASAAPKEDHRKADIIPVVCEGLGAFDVITVENAATAFGPDGQVFVAKRISGDTSGTITTHDGQTFPFSDSFTEGAKGNGFEDRLIPCSFTDTFMDTFVVDAEAASFLGIPAAYAGTEVTLAGTFNGTAWVLAPGN